MEIHGNDNIDWVSLYTKLTLIAWNASQSWVRFRKSFIVYEREKFFFLISSIGFVYFFHAYVKTYEHYLVFHYRTGDSNDLSDEVISKQFMTYTSCHVLISFSNKTHFICLFCEHVLDEPFFIYFICIVHAMPSF